MEISKESIFRTSSNSVYFNSTASNKQNYEVGLSCFSKEQTSSYEHGDLRVLKSESHVGASKVFPYSECLDMKMKIEEGKIKISMSWDQEGFEDFVSTTLDFTIFQVVNQ